ncbi:hypothetical protein Tco_0337084 [Tanacetum coccineum]
MATESTVPQVVGKKGGSYAVIAPKLEPGKFNKWKKQMLFYLTGMEPYYIKCIKDGPFLSKNVNGAIKPESQWTMDERRVVIQDQRLKNIIMSCLPNDIMESVISYEIAKATWTDLVHRFEGPSDTKDNRIMDLKLEYQTFRAKPSESLSQTYTHFKNLLNELANDGVNLSKHETNDFQENSDDEVDERTSEEYLKDLDLECGKKGHFAKDCFSKTSEPSYKSPVCSSSSVSKVRSESDVCCLSESVICLLLSVVVCSHISAESVFVCCSSSISVQISQLVCPPAFVRFLDFSCQTLNVALYRIFTKGRKTKPNRKSRARI